jgi:hypothetical protein
MELDIIDKSKPENPLLGKEPRLYVCSGDGLGATGKSIQESLKHNLPILLHSSSVGYFREPPIEGLVEDDSSPYDLVTKKGLIAKEALAPYLAAVRSIMWDKNSKSPCIVPDNPIIIGDRSPASSFLQGAYPGGDNPWGNEF